MDVCCPVNGWRRGGSGPETHPSTQNTFLVPPWSNSIIVRSRLTPLRTQRAHSGYWSPSAGVDIVAVLDKVYTNYLELDQHGIVFLKLQGVQHRTLGTAYSVRCRNLTAFKTYPPLVPPGPGRIVVIHTVKIPSTA